MNTQPPDDELASAMRTYATTFGHAVPDEVVEMFARRSWMLISEIRQAIALRRPVRGWQERARNGPPLSGFHSAAR
jgi:hypothetical protein